MLYELNEENEKLNHIIEKQDRDIAAISKGNKKLKSRIEKATEILKDTNVDMPSTLLIEIIDYGINILNGKE